VSLPCVQVDEAQVRQHLDGVVRCNPVGWEPPSREAPPQGRVEGWRGAP
jgi:hypothetical protein